MSTIKKKQQEGVLIIKTDQELRKVITAIFKMQISDDLLNRP